MVKQLIDWILSFFKPVEYQFRKMIILERLDKTIKMLDSLKESQFNYSSYVAESDNVCTTVCCVAGWYPVHIPESGLSYIYSPSAGRLVLNDNGDPYDDIINDLVKYHQLPDFIIRALFYGEMAVCSYGSKELYLNHIGIYSSSLNRVKDRFKVTRSFINSLSSYANFFHPKHLDRY